jgi:low affinity Fe/Cu permease
LAASIGGRVSRLLDVKEPRVWVVMAAVVLAIWLVGAAVTKYSLEQMAYVTPIAVVVLWVKIVLDSLRRRRGES